eukprot:GHUV01045439.1.p1 GENE.GHUV01045439.1~~GHUV01045439.1.p1  ORF type:complete len:198 (+),score=62.92 GHUV01045439.1:707-1300(+)
MGFGAVHCIMRPTDNYKKSQRTSAGADKWLDTRLWDSTEECLRALKGAGYQIVVTHLSASSVTVQDVDWTRPTAFVLGNESAGVSDTALQLADHTAIIPMAGFVESFNISVAAALIMYEAQQQRIRRLGKSGDLTEQQKQQLLASFLLRGVVSAWACCWAQSTWNVLVQTRTVLVHQGGVYASCRVMQVFWDSSDCS